MRCWKLISLTFVLILVLSGCSGNTMNNWSDQELRDLAPWLVTLPSGQIVLSPGTSNNNFVPPPPSEEEKTVEEATSGAQVLLTGRILYPNFISGSFLIEARGTRGCEKGLCPDMESKPSSSTVLDKPGLFSLVLPEPGQALFIVATLSEGNVQRDVYLGTVQNRINGIELDFGKNP